MVRAQIHLPMDAIRDFCRQWKVTELALFGSVLREDFRPDSDIDVLVTFHPDAEWGLFAFARMQEEFSELIGRDVDLLTRRGVENGPNPYRRRSILDSARVVYAE